MSGILWTRPWLTGKLIIIDINIINIVIVSAVKMIGCYSLNRHWSVKETLILANFGFYDGPTFSFFIMIAFGNSIWEHGGCFFLGSRMAVQLTHPCPFIWPSLTVLSFSIKPLTGSSKIWHEVQGLSQRKLTKPDFRGEICFSGKPTKTVKNRGFWWISREV